MQTYLIVDYEVQLSSGPPQQGIPTNVSPINKKLNKTNQ
jgi:hypothetical protein